MTNLVPITISDLQEAINKYDLSFEAKLNEPKYAKSDLAKSLEAAYGSDIETLQKIIDRVSPDVSRGSGGIDVTNPNADNWLGIVWAMASLGDRAKEIAREWSMRSPRYTEDGFESAWKSYDPSRKNAITFGSLLKLVQNLTPSAIQFKSGDTNICGFNSPRRFHFQSPDQIKNFHPIQWLVKGLFPKQGLVSIYGPSGSAKSFFVIDLISCVVLGRTFYGRKTTPCPVVYVVLEGAAGIQKRIKAYEEHHNVTLPSTLRVVTQELSLLNDDCETFSSEIVAEGLGNGVVVIDTLSQASAGGDENSSSDMSRLISSAQKIQTKTNSLVILVHHTGKDASRGARGHSSFYAALDAAIELKRTQTGREWSISKSKDSVDGESTAFKLELIKLGQDEDGDEITSCVAVSDLFRVKTPKFPPGKNQKLVLKFLEKSSAVLEPKDLDDLAAFCIPALSVLNPKQRAKESLEALFKLGYLRCVDGLYEYKK